jgi:hypothetical protein
MNATASEIAALTVAIEREAGAIGASLEYQLGEHSELPGREELCRQLRSLRDRVTRASADAGEAGELRAELATLLCFARTLRSDAEEWRGSIRQTLEALERRRAAARREEERQAAERAELVRRRNALQKRIDQEAGRVARSKRGECRRTLPVITLRPGLTVSSMTVSNSPRRFRSPKLWLVTLDDARSQVLVTRD